jgi:hypothetical protein
MRFPIQKPGMKATQQKWNLQRGAPRRYEGRGVGLDHGCSTLVSHVSSQTHVNSLDALLRIRDFSPDEIRSHWLILNIDRSPHRVALNSASR